MSDTRNVYEFRWFVRGKSTNRGTANNGVRRVLATHFDDAYAMFKSWLKDIAWRPADVSRVETAIMLVGLWIMAEISELREKA